jgi:hypothetical protein
MGEGMKGCGVKESIGDLRARLDHRRAQHVI